MSRMKFAGVSETVIKRDGYDLAKAGKTLKGETVAVIGYGTQGQAQSLNLRDSGFRVIVGQRSGTSSYEKAVKDGWKKGETLFPIEEAAERGTIVGYLLSDAGQAAVWDRIRKYLAKGKALYFSHGFCIAYRDLTGVIPPEGIDVIMVAPKALGRAVRENFLNGRGINSSYAIYQDGTGKARERALSIGIGIGSGCLFPTTFEKEVFSDLTSERGILLGAIEAVMEAQYETLRENIHTPSEAFSDTVEEFTQNIAPLIGENGMDWLYAHCSATAQRGALDWRKRFKKAVKPEFKKLYKRVRDGVEAKRVLGAMKDKDYDKKLQKELSQIKNMEIWRVGKAVRSLRQGEKK